MWVFCRGLCKVSPLALRQPVLLVLDWSSLALSYMNEYDREEENRTLLEIFKKIKFFYRKAGISPFFRQKWKKTMGIRNN